MTQDDTNNASSEYAVPYDFPRPDIANAVAGSQSKLFMVEYEGKYYFRGGTPPELRQRWDICEDMAVQFVEKCRRNQTGKYSHLSDDEILDQYRSRLLKSGRGPDARVTEIENWIAKHRLRTQPILLLDDHESGWNLHESSLDQQGLVVLCEPWVGFTTEKLVAAQRLLRAQMRNDVTS